MRPVWPKGSVPAGSKRAQTNAEEEEEKQGNRSISPRSKDASQEELTLEEEAQLRNDTDEPLYFKNGKFMPEGYILPEGASIPFIDADMERHLEAGRVTLDEAKAAMGGGDEAEKIYDRANTDASAEDLVSSGHLEAEKADRLRRSDFDQYRRVVRDGQTLKEAEKLADEGRIDPEDVARARADPASVGKVRDRVEFEKGVDLFRESGLINDEQYEAVADDPEKLRSLLDLVSQGAVLGASDAARKKALDDYAENPTPEQQDRSAAGLLVDALDLPGAARQLPRDQILDLATLERGLGTEDRLTDDAEFWERAAEAGFDSARGEVLVDGLGLPDEAKRLPSDQILDLVEMDRGLGLDEELTGDPGFWDRAAESGFDSARDELRDAAGLLGDEVAGKGGLSSRPDLGSAEGGAAGPAGGARTDLPSVGSGLTGGGRAGAGGAGPSAGAGSSGGGSPFGGAPGGPAGDNAGGEAPGSGTPGGSGSTGGAQGSANDGGAGGDSPSADGGSPGGGEPDSGPGGTGGDGEGPLPGGQTVANFEHTSDGGFDMTLGVTNDDGSVTWFAATTEHFTPNGDGTYSGDKGDQGAYKPAEGTVAVDEDEVARPESADGSGSGEAGDAADANAGDRGTDSADAPSAESTPDPDSSGGYVMRDPYFKALIAQERDRRSDPGNIDCGDHGECGPRAPTSDGPSFGRHDCDSPIASTLPGSPCRATTAPALDPSLVPDAGNVDPARSDVAAPPGDAGRQ